MPLRQILTRKLAEAGHGDRARVIPGFFDALPVASGSADLVVACSALTPAAGHGGEAGLSEMERVCRPGGCVAIVWPNNLDWLAAHGYEYVCFAGPMAAEFASHQEAVELAEIFYPGAVAEVRRRAPAAGPLRRPGDQPAARPRLQDGAAMKVAIIAPLVTAINEPQRGGSQAFVSDLARGLARRGHDVHVYAASGSRHTRGRGDRHRSRPGVPGRHALPGVRAGLRPTRPRPRPPSPACTRECGGPGTTWCTITPSTRPPSRSPPGWARRSCTRSTCPRMRR